MPNQVFAGSGKIVWWKCKNGHEWQSVIYNRVRGYGCPICEKPRVLIIHNDLQTNFPELVREWNYDKNGGLLPTMFTRSSREKVWWKCSKCGHEWLAVIQNRVFFGQGCPKCAHVKINEYNAKLRLIKGVNDLGTLYPELCLEWLYEKNNNITPFDFLPGSGKRVWWKCHICGHEWQTRIQHRTAGHGCPNCMAMKLKNIIKNKKK